jgi:hypothetical protein
MPPVLTANAKILCGPVPPHGGTVTVPPVPNPRLSVAGARVLLHADVAHQPIPTCGIVPDVPHGTIKCTSVDQPVPGGDPLDPASFSTKLTVGGQPVLMTTLAGSTNGTILKAPQRLLTAIESQTKLTTR